MTLDLIRLTVRGIDTVPHNGIKSLRSDDTITACKDFVLYGEVSPVYLQDLLAQCHYEVMGLTPLEVARLCLCAYADYSEKDIIYLTRLGNF